MGEYKPMDREKQVALLTAKIEELIQSGKDINEESIRGTTPLMFAVESGNVDLVKKLIKAGADVNSRTDFDYTPLTYALKLNPKEKRYEMMKLLIGSGADVNAITCAPEGERIPMISLAAYRGDRGAVEMLAKAGADVNARDEHDNTPLMWSSWLDTEESQCVLDGKEPVSKVMEALIEAGADVNARNVVGDTVLHNTVRRAFRYAELLIRSGADIYAKNNSGRSPMEVAFDTVKVAKMAYYSFKYRKEAAKYRDNAEEYKKRQNARNKESQYSKVKNGGTIFLAGRQ